MSIVSSYSLETLTPFLPSLRAWDRASDWSEARMKGREATVRETGGRDPWEMSQVHAHLCTRTWVVKAGSGLDNSRNLLCDHGWVILPLGFSLPGDKTWPVNKNISKGPSRKKMLGIRNHLGLHFGERGPWDWSFFMAFEGLAYSMPNIWNLPRSPWKKKFLCNCKSWVELD